ncbi:MAG: hypothetical protein KF846_18270 [Cyclobacteriaceae bacterium]|nr:hypothetical protein [Cyclobacteriaceae bacterium]
MKILKYTLLLATLLSIGLFNSCKDDDATPADVLITSHRKNGKVFKVDVTSGVLTEIFTPTVGANTLKEIRAFVYHRGEDKFFASATSFVDQDNPRSGVLYSIDPTTKVGTIINDNTGGGGSYAVWDAVVNWAVASDESLISVGDFNANGNGIVKFGVNGGRSTKTKQLNACCGFALLYDRSTGELQISNGEESDDKEIIFNTINTSGTITNTTSITTFADFPASLDNHWLTLKAMAKDRAGKIYGILFDTDVSVTYFVEVNLTTLTIRYISTIGADNNNQYNSLAYIPARYAN